MVIELERARMRTQAHYMPELDPFSVQSFPASTPLALPLSTSPPASLTVGSASAVAVGAGLAVGARRTDEGLALNGSCSAGTPLGAATGKPRLPCLWKPQEE